MSNLASDRVEIKKEAKFLEELGYTIIDEDSLVIDYGLNNIRIGIVYPNHFDGEFSDVKIRFVKENSVFSLNWIALVRNSMEGSYDSLINVKVLLRYLKENYLFLTDYQYCLESRRLVTEYVNNHPEIYKGL